MVTLRPQQPFLSRPKGDAAWKELALDIFHDAVAHLPSIVLPSCIIRLVREPPGVHPCLKITEITPTLIVLEPGVHQRLVHRVPLPHFNLKQVCDEFYCSTWDFFPWMRRIHECRILDLFMNILILIERKSSRKWHIYDDPSTPHIQGPVVALVTQDLRRQVCWCTNNRFSEPLLSNYSREAKVTQFHLQTNNWDRIHQQERLRETTKILISRKWCVPTLFGP